MENQLVTQNERGILSVADVLEQKRAIHEILERVMIKDVHYGVIPGCAKPSLYQPGAELICMTFRLAPSFTVEEIERPGAFAYRSICNIQTANGIFLGNAVGESSTDETKYMWRAAVCDEEFNETPENMRRVLWKKGRGGEAAYQVAQVRTNPADLANTASAIAQKRSLVRATRTVTAASDVFDVNTEDLAGVADIGDDAAGNGHTPIKKPTAKKPAAPPGDALIVQGVIAAASDPKETTTGGKRYGFRIGDAWFNTFDDKMAAACKTGALVTITYTTDKYGNKIVSVEASGMASE